MACSFASRGRHLSDRPIGTAAYLAPPRRLLARLEHIAFHMHRLGAELCQHLSRLFCVRDELLALDVCVLLAAHGRRPHSSIKRSCRFVVRTFLMRRPEGHIYATA